jgi:hypothetical protein
MFCLQATAETAMFWGEFERRLNNPVSENSEGRLTVRLFGSATIVPLDTSAQKASPSLVWAMSEQSLELVLWNLDSREQINCGSRITGERGSYLKLLLFKFSVSGLISVFLCATSESSVSLW